MRLGAVFPHLDIGSDPGEISEWAAEVEQMGFSQIVAYDHVLGAGTDSRPGWRGYTSDDPFHEVFVLFGYFAAITESVDLVTGVLVLPQRQTALVAKQAAQVDVLSGGRMRLGIGVGWNPVEYQALAEPFSERGARSEEQIELLRRLWAEPLVTFRGRYDEVVDAGINPRPTSGTIPIWIGGSADAVLRRVGRLGDGWLPQGPPDARSAELVDRVRGYAVEAGRAATDVGFEARLSLNQTPTQEWESFFHGWRDLGAGYLDVNTMGLGHSTARDHLYALKDALDAARAAGVLDD